MRKDENPMDAESVVDEFLLTESLSEMQAKGGSMMKEETEVFE